MNVDHSKTIEALSAMLDKANRFNYDQSLIIMALREENARLKISLQRKGASVDTPQASTDAVRSPEVKKPTEYVCIGNINDFVKSAPEPSFTPSTMMQIIQNNSQVIYTLAQVMAMQTREFQNLIAAITDQKLPGEI